MKNRDIGFKQACDISLRNIKRMESESVSITRAVDRVTAEDVCASSDCPSTDSSMKDGYAVVSSDVKYASPDSPAKLDVIGAVGAGDRNVLQVTKGKAVRILSGAPVPKGAEAVLAEEFTESGNGSIQAVANAEKGRNILFKGEDVKNGETLINAGQTLTPSIISLLVAGGISNIRVFKRPKVGLLATGSEVLLPGIPLREGFLFAGNLALQNAWLSSFGIETEILTVKDSIEEVTNSIKLLIDSCDILITSGGAWKSDRDLILKAFANLGADILFHRVRMGPGKAAGMSILSGKPVFCLPGGPPSNETAFIFIALPAVLKIAGYDRTPYLYLTGKLEREICGQLDWTQFAQCCVIQNDLDIILRPIKLKSRLASMAGAQAIVQIPEGVDKIAAGDVATFLCLDREVFSRPAR